MCTRTRFMNHISIEILSVSALRCMNEKNQLSYMASQARSMQVSTHITGGMDGKSSEFDQARNHQADAISGHVGRVVTSTATIDNRDVLISRLQSPTASNDVPPATRSWRWLVTSS